VFFQPRKQGGSKVETYVLIVADRLPQPSPLVENSSVRIGRIALFSYPRVPVMKGVSGFLSLDRVQPGILSRRLIEVAMNANVSTSLRGHFTYLGSKDFRSRHNALTSCALSDIGSSVRSLAA
jgi:hypothetical protein